MKNKIKHFILKNKVYLIVFICLIFFLEIAEDVFESEIMKIDIIGYELISKYIISDFFTPIAKFITNFGGPIYLIIIASILFFVIKNKKISLSIVLNLILVAILNQSLKHIVQRKRPTEFRLIDESGYSFPSGHSMASIAFYGFLIYLICKKIESKKIKIILTIFLSILTLCIGLSRIYLGVHYTSDVLAGFLISISYLIIYINIVDDYIGTK